MITTGTQLLTFINSLNAEADVDPTLADVLVDNGRAILEGERPWMVLRKTDTSKTVTSSNTWQTAIDLSTITDFGRFYGEFPVRLFDGDNRTERYQQVPFEDRLLWKDSGNTFCYDAGTKTLYLNGRVPFSGTLYINILVDTGAISLTSDTAVWSRFPSRFLPLLGYYAIGVHKGAVDYDSINREMLGPNAEAFKALKGAMVNWDNEMQLSSLEGNDPSEDAGGWPKSGRINRNA